MADPFDPPQYEIRLVRGCGCVTRWAVFNKPAPADEELRSPNACSDCQAATCGAIPAEALELIAEARRHASKPRRRPRD